MNRSNVEKRFGYRWVGIWLFLGGAVLLIGVNLFRQIPRNLGYVALTRSLLSDSEETFGRSETWFKRALQAPGPEERAQRGLAVLRAAEGKMEKARSALDGEQERELSRILVSWGDRASRQGEWEQAVRWYENALLINQQNPRAWCQLGQVQVALGDLERAKDALQYAVELDDPLCVRPYGMVFYEQGAYDRAIQIWSEALESYPDHKERKEWYLDIAFTWLKVEDWQKVLDVVEQGRAEFPEESRFYYQRGLALYEGFGQTEAALADFKKAIAMNVGNAAPYRALGDLYIQEGQYPEAASWYAQAVRRDPGNLVWYLSWADAALGAGDMDQAIQAYQAARERFPTHQRILYQLADLYHRAGQLPEAAAVIEEALTFADQDQVDMYLLAGAIFEAQGNKPAARDAYEQVLRVEPQNQTALEGLSRIED